MSGQVDRPKVRRMGKTDVMAHLVEHFAARSLTLGRADAREFLEELHRLCVQQLKDTGEFTLPCMAKFVMRQRPARNGRNPATGEAIRIEAKKGGHRPRCAAAQGLALGVNELPSVALTTVPGTSQR